jgi:hypothetical protein
MEGSARRCANCRTGRALRKYCRRCSPKSSALYKRQLRLEAKAGGEKYWLEWWEKAFGEQAGEKRREYQRKYMREYRRRKRERRAA